MDESLESEVRIIRTVRVRVDLTTEDMTTYSSQPIKISKAFKTLPLVSYVPILALI